MVDKVKIEPKIITIHEGRISFFRTEATYRTDKFGKEVKVGADGKAKKPQWRMTWLLDPSNAQAAATIAEIKAEGARVLDLFYHCTPETRAEKWPKDNPTTGRKGVLACFGEGNKLPKVYDGYKDMFYIKVADTTEPVWGDRRGRSIRFIKDDGAWHVIDRNSGQVTEEVVDPAMAPYGGAFGRGRLSLYPWEYDGGGVNANFRSVQFVRPGDAFGGNAKRSAADELAEMAGDAEPARSAGTNEADPWG